ncbi:hypothetical protein PBOR_13935 [Paenibacillus borealis]|uniref:Threonine aldolase n=1 Tax=Paenibacillus borealis TaxID=160799 RepID=A0A089LAV1_PAEBO|nr:hypothetical protein PBOR_13935 [Paenibacillus borealis]
MRYDSMTNQQFPVLPLDALTALNEKYSFSLWEQAGDNHSVVRFCTSWATKRENVERLIEDIVNLA